MFREGHQANTRVHFALIIALVLSGCETTPDDQAAIDGAFDHSNIPTAPSAPAIPITEITGCRVERFSQPEATIAEKLDLLFVFDTSASLNAERGRVADGIDAFIAELPPSIDLRIAVMPAHGPKSSWAGKLFRRNSSEPWVLDSKVHSLTQIRAILKDKLTKNQPQDNESDGGEMGLYSLTRGMDADRVVLAQSQGFFRSDAALALAFLADENDICATYPTGVTPLVDPQGVENKAIRRGDCTGITQNNLLAKLKVLKGSYPLTVGGVIYNNVATVPREDENEFGYGYFDFIQYANGITIDMADANYRTGLSNFGNRASVALNLKTEFEVATNSVSPASIYVLVDGLEVPAQLSQNDENRIVLTTSAGISKSTIDITYCDLGPDTTSPVLSDLSVGTNSIAKIGNNPISGKSNEPVSYVEVNGRPLNISQDRKSFTGNISFTSTGQIALHWSAIDMAGNRIKVSELLEVKFWETNSPTVAANLPGVLTIGKNSTFDLQFETVDESDAETVIIQNGHEVYRDTFKSGSITLTLQEGINLIRVFATDSFGNQSQVIENANLVLDSVAPIISVASPQNGSSPLSLTVPISGSSNEALSTITANGTTLTLSTNKRTFSGSIVFAAEGQQVLTLVATDPAGNVSTQQISIQIVLRLINASLISVFPDSSETKLVVHGAIGATVPRGLLKLSGGIFSSQTTVAAEDGSFEFTSSPFTQATLTVTDPITNRTEITTVRYLTDTTLSGSVRDTSNRPLANAKIEIAGTALTTYTNSAGVFSFPQPVTGDQILTVDGSTANLEPNANVRYFQTKVPISIGLNQSNVLERPIFLAPLTLDGAQTWVDSSSDTLVTSPHAPGVELTIPAGSAIFPDGSTTGAVSMALISSDFSTIAPPDFSTPEKVLVLEPSGLKFTKPVRIRMPNYYSLPEGVELVLLSMNSSKGIFELDAILKVIDPNTIETKDGSGLSHFSVVYASPVGPKVTEIGGYTVAGADTFAGDSSTQISPPSYRALGVDVNFPLQYRSSWAKPTAVVSNIFDIPKLELNLTLSSSSRGFFTLIRTEITDSLTAWFEPRKITAQFSTNDIEGDSITYDGVPNKAVVSFATDLKASNSTGYMLSGNYPYRAHYEVFLDQIVVTTRKTRKWKWFGKPKVSQEKYEETREIEKAFPADLIGTIPVKNEIDSPVGRGWKIAVGQKIIDQENSRISIEEPNGQYSLYALNNTISTLFDGTSQAYRFADGGSLAAWPFAYFVRTEGSGNTAKEVIDEISLAGPNPSVSNSRISVTARPQSTQTYYVPTSQGCELNHFTYSQRGIPSRIIRDSSGGILFTDFAFSQIFRTVVGNSPSTIAGRFESPPLPTNPYNNPYFNDCETIPGVTCSRIRTVLFGANCPRTLRVSGGDIGGVGYVGAPALPSVLNRPRDLIEFATNKYLIADYGNHRIRIVDLSNSSISDFAGNGQTTDSGDGGPATSAGLFHPRGLARDAAGNVYISTESGSVRKVDFTGRISTLVGASGATPGDNQPGVLTKLTRPAGMVVDDSNGYLYIADEGDHVVRRLELLTGLISTVAGQFGQIGFSGDNGPALLAKLNSPTDVGLDDQGNLTIVDAGNTRVRRVLFQSAANGQLTYKPATKDNSTLVRLGNGSWQRSYRDGSTSQFDTLGRQILHRNPLGHEMWFSYNGPNGVLSAVRDPTNQITTFTYSGSSLTGITDPSGRTTSIDSTNGLLNSVTFPDGGVRTFHYDSFGRLEREVNQAGTPTEYSYNDWSRLEKVTHGNLIKTEILDAISQSVGNGSSDLSRAQLRSFGLNPEDLTDAVRDSNGNVIRVVKDQNGLALIVVDPTGKPTLLSRDAEGKILSLQRENGSKIIFTYDPVTGDLLSEEDTQTNTKLEQTFLPSGALSQKKNGRGLISKYTYNSYGQLLTSTDPAGNVTSHAYDSVNNPFRLPTSSTNTRGGQTKFTYDSLGNLLTSTDPKNRTSHFTYDSWGNILTSTSPSNAVTKYSYDQMNRLIEVEDPTGKHTYYKYRTSGELLEVKDHYGNLITYTYNGNGQIESKTDQNGSTYGYSYDEFGNLKTLLDPNGKSTTYSYDSMNRIVRKSTEDDNVEYVYDANGRLSLVKNKESSISYNLGNDGEPLSSQEVAWANSSHPFQVSLAFEHSENGLRKTFTDPLGGVTRYSYDDIDRTSKIVNPSSEVFTYAYNDTIGKLSITRPGTTTDVEIDTSGYLNKISHKSGGSNVASYLYTYNSMSGILERTTTTFGSRDTQFDSVGRLIASTNPETPNHSVGMDQESFSYDAISNRISDQRPGGTNSFDNSKQKLLSDWKWNYIYDNNGNLTGKHEKGLIGEAWQYDYSVSNQLKSVRAFRHINDTSPYLEVNFAYNALGNRIEKRVVNHEAPSDIKKNFIRRYAYDGQRLIVEFDGSSQSPLVRYTYGPGGVDDVVSAEVFSNGQLLGIAPEARTYFFLKDGIGSIIDVTNSTGALVQHYVYSAFGEILKINDSIGQTVTENPVVMIPFAFGGREYDREIGLYYARARYYDPSTGRFIQRDPFPGKLELPGTVTNSYIFGLNNPSTFTDPSGKFILEGIFAFLSITGFSIAAGATVEAALLSALYAVGAAMSGAIVTSAIMSTISGEWGKTFWNNVDNIFSNTAIYLGLSAVGAHFWGGGVKAAGANNYLQGYVQSNKPIFGIGGGLTVGTGATISGVYPGEIDIAGEQISIFTHEFGHTVQFAALSGISAITKGGPAWIPYFSLGVAGLGGQLELGGAIGEFGILWERMASHWIFF